MRAHECQQCLHSLEEDGEEGGLSGGLKRRGGRSMITCMNVTQSILNFKDGRTTMLCSYKSISMYVHTAHHLLYNNNVYRKKHTSVSVEFTTDVHNHHMVTDALYQCLKKQLCQHANVGHNHTCTYKLPISVHAKCFHKNGQTHACCYTDVHVATGTSEDWSSHTAVQQLMPLHVLQAIYLIWLRNVCHNSI